MNFTVFYVLVVVFADNGGIHSMVGPKTDLQECRKGAARAMAALPENTAKWACHEMTVETKGNEVYVNFPNN